MNILTDGGFRDSGHWGGEREGRKKEGVREERERGRDRGESERKREREGDIFLLSVALGNILLFLKGKLNSIFLLLKFFKGFLFHMTKFRLY